MPLSPLIDRIYEAAFVPSVWTDVLEQLALRTGSEGGVIFAGAPSAPPRFVASDKVAAAMAAYASGGTGANSRPARALAKNHFGFLRDIDFLPVEDFGRDCQQRELRSFGLGWQVGTVAPLLTQELAVLTIDRAYDNGPHQPEHVALLDQLRPHLTRAMMMSARLGMTIAETTLGTLEAVGLAALVINRNRQVLAVNQLAQDHAVLVPLARGGLALAHDLANRLFQASLEAGLGGAPAQLRSVPVPATDERPAMVVHALPLRGQAHDLLSGAEILVVINSLDDRQAADGSILRGLFDLTAAEARLAQNLMRGATIGQISGETGVSIATLRSQLRALLAKTGTQRQAELMVLLMRAGLSGHPIAD
ncbi:hypothetical protein [Gemmobacter sp. 24YEA27]|uniref:helix-turn-helix transcriptional regulator n=1 Tax=Gemmobacter sp. 24YEA27 TaxID=3040672 RepID=UPI0024B391D5|nr:hypothetical protein [Gemmobacter sp. 24YEA27]